jgi:cellobiose phosphorylase
MTADVYGIAPHTGRGGWSWYTGSAGWMYRLIVESLLGLRLETSAGISCLSFAPCLPADWPGYTLEYRYRQTPYHIEIARAPGAAENGGACTVWVDGVVQGHGSVRLLDDGQAHRVRVQLGPS